ncbi:MAG: class I SAM-dependent methyltransferase [Ideonella sp.]|nr:class I SAM-dependent methyltransferase [Ideonella sp.]MCC6727923.1 class I SAM-dependent methyltransferase [Chthonomonadales bacterium]
MTGWDHPATAERYERFNQRHARYRRANDVLVREAALVSGLRVLDFGAGTGRTASAALGRLGRHGSVVCVEPAAAMREAGQRRLRDSRVTWRGALPEEPEAFDRVLAGAVVWQLDPFRESIARLVGLLRHGGALAFDIPALYLGEPDEPGGGDDPLLLDLVARLAEGRPADREGSGLPRAAGARRFTPADVEAALRSADLQPRSWAFRQRLTQTAHARWLTIPVLTDGLLPGVAPVERDRRIARALALVDRKSFKWERWRGWTAWRP